ncbi:MAG: GNAT family N-acetyltransferase [Clostridia bacterium]|nr:GNAT family N-acetyltransferase [Clostridia bacterium]
MNGLEFKQAQPEDVETIFRLCKENIDKYEDISSIPYDEVIEWVQRKINKCISEYTRIYKDGALCGYYRVHLDENEYELDDFYLFEEYRRQGIGSAVLEKCIKEADKPVYLYVFKRNEGAVKLYKKFGFEVKEDLGTRYIMEKRV